MKIEFIPLDYEAFDFNENNLIKIFGRTKQGKKVCVIDEYEANFWAVLKEGLSEKKIQEIQKEIEKIQVKGVRLCKVLRTEVHNKKFLGKDVKAIKIFITNHKDGHDIADKIDFKEIEKRREYDIPIITKYIMEKEVSPLNLYEVEGEIFTEQGANSLEVDLCLKANRIKPLKENGFEPRILAYDIEADEIELGKGNILMISLYGKNFKKVLTWKNCKDKQDFVECFKNEEEMLEKFVENVKKYNPDLLVGYFSDGFDLPYLKAVADKHKIKLNLGLDDSQPKFTRGIISSGKISGYTHVDLYRFIATVYSQYLQSETLSLDEVSHELLNERKKDFDFLKIGKMNENDWKDFFEYNLQDSYLAYKLTEKLWPDMLELSKIIKEPLYNITRDGMSQHVENYILHNLKKYNEIAEKRPIHEEIKRRVAMGKYEGAFVFQPNPGLYENLGVFDFTSMYPSVIVSYNLSLASFLSEKEKDSLEVDVEKQKYYFSKEKSFFVIILEEIIEKRKEHKRGYKENPSPLLKARSNAYKLLANASYGYQGFFGARYYCRPAAAATTALGRKVILETIEKIKNEGYSVVYSDTDSIAFLLDGKTKKQTFEFLEKLNKTLPGIMELELESFYKRGLFVSKRIVKEGAKKKYALIEESGKVKIRGFETVRRDWCTLARVLQNEVLENILNHGNEKKALEIIKDVIKKVKERKVNLEDLMIITQLKKDINEYKSISPHVIAAKKMEEQGIPVSQGMLIKYFVAETREKKTLVREKVKLPNEKGLYNIEYYLERQILPAVENIIDVFGINLKEIISGKKQMKLF